MPVPNQAADRKPIVCDICQKGFSSKQTKKAHMLIVHENAGSFKCGHCEKTFQSEKNLKEHENSHTGKKPLKCKDCSKRFNAKSNLKRHELDVHSEKKFKCPHPQCEMAFGRERGLKLHHQDRHAEKKFKCPQCDSAFGREEEHGPDDRIEHDLDDPMESCSKRIKIEPEEIELAPIEPTDFEAYDFNELAAANMKRMKMESEAITGLVDQGDELVQESSTVASANLKLVFDEEYRAPE